MEFSDGSGVVRESEFRFGFRNLGLIVLAKARN